MKPKLLTLLVLSLWFFVADVLADTESDDKTLSPYFLVLSEETDLEQLPLKSTKADVSITGVIADVVVTQVYENTGKVPIEAIYVFPGSTRAAVYGMSMKIGERLVRAKIQERKRARKTYEKAKQQGKSASLLEQQRPNVFQMNVANIMPGDIIQVELRYTELLTPTEHVYEFVYPTVVGPRYSNQSLASAPKSERWIQNPYLEEGKPAPYSFDIDVHLSAGMPLKDLQSVSHKVDIKFEDKDRANVSLKPIEQAGGDRDFILQYRLAGEEIESGLLLYEGEEENFFLALLEPPKRVRAAEIPPREYIFIVDVSGSMRGFPLDVSKSLLRDLIGQLRPSDKFNVLLFAGSSSLLSTDSLPATQENVTRAIRHIDNQRGGGGTEVLPALRRALSIPQEEESSRTLVIVTDGYVSVEQEAFDLIRSRLGDANFFTFGIGSSVNRYLLEGMARVGLGEPFIVTRREEASETARRFRLYLESPVLTNIELDFDDFEVYEVEPPSIPDVIAERPIAVYGKWRGKPRGRIRIQGINGKGEYEDSINVAKAHPSETNSALSYLWARQRIQLLGDYYKLFPNDERVEEITALGLKYNLLTKFTSFIAVDEVIRRKEAPLKSVKQPLPLPKGVSKHAIGGGIPSVPEPSMFLLITVLGLLFLALTLHRNLCKGLLNPSGKWLTSLRFIFPPGSSKPFHKLHHNRQQITKPDES